MAQGTGGSGRGGIFGASTRKGLGAMSDVGGSMRNLMQSGLGSSMRHLGFSPPDSGGEVGGGGGSASTTPSPLVPMAGAGGENDAVAFDAPSPAPSLVARGGGEPPAAAAAAALPAPGASASSSESVEQQAQAQAGPNLSRPDCHPADDAARDRDRDLDLSLGAHDGAGAGAGAAPGAADGGAWRGLLAIDELTRARRSGEALYGRFASLSRDSQPRTRAAIRLQPVL